MAHQEAFPFFMLYGQSAVEWSPHSWQMSQNVLVCMKIDDKGLGEVDSLGIETYTLVDLASVSFAIKRGTDAHTVRTRTELT